MLGATLAQAPVSPHGHISGWVVDNHGAAVAGAWVRIEPAAIDLRDWPLRHVPNQVISDPDGSYHFDALAYGRYRLQAGAEGLLDSESVEVELNPDRPRAETYLVLEPGVELRGIAMTESGGPLAEVEILAFPDQDPANQRSAKSAADGSFAIRGLPAGLVRIYAQAEDRAPLLGIPLEAPAEHVELRLDPPASLRGRVLEAGSGCPVESFSLTLRGLGLSAEPSASIGNRAAYRFTSPSGRFRFDDLAPGIYEVAIAAEGYATGRFQLEAPSEPSEIPLPLEPACRLIGQVHDPSNQGIGGASIRLEAEETERARTDADGRFELGDLPPGTTQLLIRHPSYAPLTLGPFELTPVEPVEVNAAMRPGARIEGWAFDADGDPAAGGVVAVRAPNGSVVRAGVGPYGFYHATGLAAGHYQLALIPQFQPVELGEGELRRVEIGEGKTLEVDFGVQGCRVFGLVGDASDPYAGGLLRWTPVISDQTEAQAREMRINPDGSFRTPPLVPGLYAVSVLDPTQDQMVQLDAVAVPPDQYANINLTPGSAELRGAIRDDTGRPLGGALVEVRTGSNEPLGWIRCDPAGHFDLRGLQAGAAQIRAAAPGYLKASSPLFELGQGAVHDLGELSLRRGAVLFGNVMAAAGGALTGADVRLETEAGTLVQRVETGPGGRYRIDGLDRGPYVLTVQHEDQAPFRQTGLQLEVGGERQLQVALGVGAGLLVKMLDSNGAPLEGVRLELEPVADLVLAELGDTSTDASGTWQRSRLAPGVYRLEAARDGIVQSAQFELHEGRQTKLTFQW